MVDVKPFNGITYNKEKIKKLDDVMSPPYDIVSLKMQDELYKKNDYNIIRLILGKEYPYDNENNNRYTRAKEFFDKWLKDSILVESDGSAIYPYKVKYDIDGKEKIMNSFFVTLKLDHDYKEVKAHERTLSKPKEDRLNLMRTTKANLEPIELLYIDEKDEIRTTIDSYLDNLVIDVEGYDGFHHMLWKVDNQEVIEEIEQKLESEILFIADGHHRYQTAINYAEEVKAGENDPENYIMVVLANMFDEGLSILPTHRLISIKTSFGNLIKRSKEYFNVEKIDFPDESSVEEKGKNALKLIYTSNEHKFLLYNGKSGYLFTLKEDSIMDRLAPDHSKTWRTLDVSILHKLLLERILGINEKNLEDHIKYTRDTNEAIKLVDSNLFDFSIIMNPTKIEELKAIADAGEHMPQKSTYFLPKLLSGLVMRRFH